VSRTRRPPIRITSMTGFGQAEGRVGDLWVRVEVKSLNHRSVDFGFSLPPGWDALELPIRERVSHHIQRGKVWIRIYATPLSLPREAFPFREIEQLVAELHRRGIQPVADVPHLMQLVQQSKMQEAPPIQPVLKLVDAALQELARSRKAEGQRLKAFFGEALQKLKTGLRQARRLKELEITRLKARLPEIQKEGETSPEVADLYLRIRREIEGEEELTRLESHIQALDQTLRQRGPKGRKVEFLLQEIHREWTTLAHKSSLPELVHLTIEMREVVDQLKEQSRNVE